MDVKSRVTSRKWLIFYVLPIILLPAFGYIFLLYLAPIPPGVGTPASPGPVLGFFLSSTPGLISLLAFAMILGTTSFFSPCCFPLLPGHLTRNAEVTTQTPSQGTVRRILPLGLSAASGLFLFVFLLGSAITLLGYGFGRSVRIITLTNANTSILDLKILAGIGLVLLGTLGLRGTRIFSRMGSSAPLASRLANNALNRPTLRMFSYGFGYGALGTACTGPMIVGIALFAAGIGAGILGAVSAFLLFATIQFLWMVGVSLIVALSPSALKGLPVRGHRLRKVAAMTQVGTGVFIILVSYFNTGYVQFLFG